VAQEPTIDDAGTEIESALHWFAANIRHWDCIRPRPDYRNIMS